MTPDDRVMAGGVGIRKRRGRVRDLGEAAGQTLPPISEKLRAEVNAARKVHQTRPATPGVRVFRDGEDSWKLDSPHRDLEAWEVQICEAFGTRSHAVMWTFLDQIAGLCEQRWRVNPAQDGGRNMPDETELNFILALIHAERPDSPLQAAMLAQMCATHMMQIRLSGLALGHESWVDPNKAMLAGKLANAFANQTDAYLRLRGRTPKQEITVSYERHVHVHHHKHAHLHQDPPVEGGGLFSRQSHEATRSDGISAGESQGGAALPGPDAAGNVMPIPNRAGESPVPHPRRAQSRRAEG